MGIKTFRDLVVWKKAHGLALDIYRYSNLFPKDEKFGLISQLRRAAVSIPTNIARGSLEEVKYLLLLSKDLSYLNKSLFLKLDKICSEISILLYYLKKKLSEI